MKAVTVLFLSCSLFSASSALRCYTCSTTEDELDYGCVNTPSADLIRDCSKRYCNIIRVEYLDPRGRVESMSRGCNDVYLNGVTEDATHRIYQVSCKDDLCNGGSGKDQGWSNRPSLGDKSTIYCPGISARSEAEVIAAHYIFTIIMIAIILY